MTIISRSQFLEASDENEIQAYLLYAQSLLDALQTIKYFKSFSKDLNQSSLDQPMLRDCFKHENLSLEARVLPIMVNWKQVVGDISEATRPHSYRKNARQLVVRVKNSTWSNELDYQKEQLKRSINQKAVHFEAEDLGTQLAQLGPKNWIRYLQLANERLSRTRLPRALKDEYGWHLRTEHQFKIPTAAHKKKYQDHFNTALTYRYAKDPLVKSIGLITGELYQLSETNEAAFHQALQKQEVMEAARVQASTISQAELENVSEMAQTIGDKQLRTAFTELASFARKAGPTNAPRKKPSSRPEL